MCAECVFHSEPMRMLYTAAKIHVKANCQFNYDHVPQTISLSKSLVHDHVIYVCIYLFIVSNLFNFIYLKF